MLPVPHAALRAVGIRPAVGLVAVARLIVQGDVVAGQEFREAARQGLPEPDRVEAAGVVEEQAAVA